MAHHTTPLRRISQGSLSTSLSSSHPRPSSSTSGHHHNNADPSPIHSTTGLDFLAPALSDLVDEIEGLHENLLGIGQLSQSLAVFNEGFAGFLYGLRMNAFSVEWPQAPNEISFDLHRNPPTPPPSQTQSLPPAPASPSSPSHASHPPNPADATYATAYSLNVDDLEPSHPVSGGASEGGSGLPRRGIATRGGTRGVRGGSSVGTRGRGGASRGGGSLGPTGGAAKKKQQAQIAALVDTLPLEFRGSQPALRQAMEKVVSSLLNTPEGMKMPDLITSTALAQPRVNKCLIALVGKKAAVKINQGGMTVYQLVGI